MEQIGLDSSTKSHRPTILVFVNHYLPGYKAGGPIQSIANLVAHFGNEFIFRIVTSDRDAGDSAPFTDIAPETWHSVGKAFVMYLAKSEQHLGRFRNIFQSTPHDLVYFNSYLHPRFTTLPLIARNLSRRPRRPVLLAPRGEFSAGALALGTTKKKSFMVAANLARLHKGVIWHASNDHEVEDIRKSMGAVPIRVASDLPRPIPKHPPQHTNRKPGDPVRIIFLSRISPMKNLHFLLEVLRKVRFPVRLQIVGSISAPDYWSQCQDIIRSLPPHITAMHAGDVKPTEVPRLMAENDLFALPTLGENFGHVVIEALQAGTPVLLSDRTPWMDLSDKGAGWTLPLSDQDGFLKAIEKVATEPTAETRLRRDSAFSYARHFHEGDALLAENRQIFRDLAHRVQS